MYMLLHDAHVPAGNVPVKELANKVSRFNVVILVIVGGMGPVREQL